MSNARPLLAGIAAASAIVLGLGLPAPADATSSSTPPSRPAAAKAAGKPVIADVTLITGHRVRLSRQPDGRQGAIIDPPAGGDPNAFVFTDKAGDVHVVPRQVQPYLQAGRLDERLFNVSRLVAQGYDDRRRSAIPLIVTYGPSVAEASQAGALKTAGAAEVRTYASAGAVAVKVAKKSAGSFWDRVNGAADVRTSAPVLLGGARKIWLDGRVRATLDQSVPLVGAPQAWSAGYDGRGVKVAVLDTGYDAKHPDLAGKVTDSSSFVPGSAVADGHGHGTHVAATVAGTGGASAGKRKGVAPGAPLMVGKVLDDGGSGDESWVLAGMEWAARGGAKVVSMSLGGDPTDGRDVLSAAVDALTASTGALFVVAAGNSGPSDRTVGTPGAATQALTVGNTTKSDELADSSSRGPRLDDSLVKPEITAPGTDIVAARAAGTSMGAPVDEHYTSATGTSMATPHVAGAAAILAQRHPEWSPAQLKAALVGSAHPLPGMTVFEQGAGRLDVPAALGTTVTVVSSTLSFGFLPWPGTGAGPVTRTATYHNGGSEPVTLALSTQVAYATGEPLPSGALTLGASQLTVPAGQTAAVDLTVDPAKVEPGDVTGVLTATGTGTPAGKSVSVRTPLSYGEENERYNLRINAIGRDGKPSTGWVQLWSRRMGSFFWFVEVDQTGPQTLRLPKDDYLAVGASTVLGTDGALVEETVSGQPQVTLSKDTTVTLDARVGKPLSFSTPQPATASRISLGWARWYEGGDGMDMQMHYGGPFPRLAVAPSAPVRDGRFEFVAGGRFLAPAAARQAYSYDLLVPTAGALPASGAYRIRPRDLARLDTTYAGVGEAVRKTRESRIGFSPNTYLRAGGWSPVTAPGPRADYVSANGSTWSSTVPLPQAGDEDVPTMYEVSRAYPPGARLPIRWWGAPLTVGTESDFQVAAAYRIGDRLSVLLRDYQDGVASHWGDSYFFDSPVATVRSRFFQGGKQLVDVKRPDFELESLPAAATSYRLVHSVTRRGPIWTTSAYSESDWTFRSARTTPADGEFPQIPLLDLDWTLRTDVQNRARALSLFPVDIQARHIRGLKAGRLGPVRMSISYDDGKSWRYVPLIPHGGDRYTALVVHPPKSRTSGWVSLRGEVSDTAGGSLKQTTIRAYALVS